MPDETQAVGGGDAPGAAPSGEPPVASPSRALAIALIVGAAFVMQGMDSTMLTVAIPTISRDLDASPLALHFAITAYTISLAVFMPVSGWFADRFGARWVFCAALVVFTIGSMLCGVADNLIQMVMARVLQGFGGAVMTPVGRLIVLRAYGKGRVLDAMTYMTLPALLGPLLGPMVGGTIVTFMPWQWIFFVNLPICGATIALSLWIIAPDKPGQAESFDFRGFVIAGTGLVLFQLAVENIGHPFAGSAGSFLFIGAALALAFLYKRHADSRANPAFDLQLFKLRAFSVGVIGGGIGRIGLNSTAFLIPLLLQVGFGLSPLKAALYALVGALGAFGTKPLIRMILTRLGYRKLLVTLATVGGALLAGCALFQPDVSLFVLLPYVLIMGAVRTIHFNTVNTLTYSDVPSHLLSRAVSSAGVIQQLSMGMGISVSAAVLGLSTGADHNLTMKDFHVAFIAMGCVPLLSLPFLLRLRDEGAGRSRV